MQARLAPHSLNVDIPACPTIATIRRAVGDVLLAQEGDAAVPAGAGVEGEGAGVGEGLGGVVGWGGGEVVVLIDVDGWCGDLSFMNCCCSALASD